MGAQFKALNEAVLMALAKILEFFFPFRVSQPLCEYVPNFIRHIRQIDQSEE